MLVCNLAWKAMEENGGNSCREIGGYYKRALLWQAA